MIYRRSRIQRARHYESFARLAERRILIEMRVRVDAMQRLEVVARRCRPRHVQHQLVGQ